MYEEDDATSMCCPTQEKKCKTMHSPPMSPFSEADSQSSFDGNVSGLDDSQSDDCNEDKYDAEVLDKKQLLARMTETVQRLVTILAVNDTEARYLLNQNRWNTDKLIDVFLQLANDDDFRRQHGLVVRQPALHSNTKPKTECDICMGIYDDSCSNGNGNDNESTIDESDPLLKQLLIGTNECEHKFCIDCWHNYLVVRIVDEMPGQTIACPAYGCCALVEDSLVMRLLRDNKNKYTFGMGIVNVYVQQNPVLRWCPAADCVYAVSVNCVQSRTVQCRCEHEFCFGCGNNSHEPVDCDMMDKWNTVLSAADMTADWLCKNAKKCAHCGIHIQKNGGCNFIRCISCNKSFCWLCGQSWDMYSAWRLHKCNVYRENDVAGNSNSNSADNRNGNRHNNNNPHAGNAGNAVSSNGRRTHFIARYLSHLDSSHFEQKLNENTEERLDVLQRTENIARTSLQFVKRAMRALLQSRRILCATYVFAYYTAECNQLYIFLDNQRDLEVAVERLSYKLQYEWITADTLKEYQEDLETKLGYCQRRQNSLLKHVREGEMMGWWNKITD